MDTLVDRRGCLASPLARIGVGLGLLAVLFVFVLLFGADDTDDDAADGPSARDTLPADLDALPRAESGRRTITLDDGQTLDLDLFIAPTAETTILAAPSRNADITSITPVGELLVDADCANVIAFDAQTVDASPLRLYNTLFALLLAGEFGPIADGDVGTLGASFTALPSWQAARDNGATYNFLFAPSDTFPDDASSAEVPIASLFVGEGDTGFLPQFEQWKAAGFNGVTVPGSAHGSALFTGPDDAVALNRLERALCF